MFKYRGTKYIFTMNEISTTLKKTYDWSIYRMNELCTEGDIEQLKDAVSIRQ